MNNLEKQYFIKKENLNPISYFQSILQEAYRLKLLTDSELKNIQLESIRLLAKETERYTGGESSSVKIETAQSIMQSIFYSIGFYLKSLPNVDISIEVLKQKTLLEMHKYGKELIEIQFNNAKKLLYAIQNDGIVTDNCAYNDTIQNGVPIFFSTYDIEFAAHDTPASIDYPLSNDNMDLVGIEYIYNYLQKLFIENQFCKNFTEDEIRCLLRGYNDNYEDLLINIFELVLTNVVGSVLLNKNAIQLNIEPLNRKYLQQKFMNLSKDKLDTILEDAYTQIYEEFNISDTLSQKYIYLTVVNLSSRLKNALENNQLESIFVSLKENHTQPALLFEDGEKIDDELFRSITDEIRECRYVSDKIAIIQRKIHSITDLADILEGYCIFDDEFTEVFKSLGDMELALLLKKIPRYVVDSDLHFTEDEKEWHGRLSCFLEEIDLTRRESIKGLSEKISLE